MLPVERWGKRRHEKLCWVFVSVEAENLGVQERVEKDYNSIWSDDHRGHEWNLPGNQIRQEVCIGLRSQLRIYILGYGRKFWPLYCKFLKLK